MILTGIRDVMVTGSSGFLGQYVIRELCNRNIMPWHFDKHTDTAGERPDGEGWDITKIDDVFDVVCNVDAVIHLAGVLGTEELFENPHKAVDVNIKGTLNIIQACVEYENPLVCIQMPNTEWTNIYQATKFCSQQLANAYRIHRGLHVSFVRAFNAYGIGQKVHGVQKFMPTFATRAWRNQPLPIWGTGEQMIDMVHASDIARMLVDALAFGNGEMFDAGTGYGTTVRDVAEMIINAVGSESSLEFLPMRAGELQQGVPPIAKGEGWNHIVQPVFRLDHFLETVNWYKEDRP